MLQSSIDVAVVFLGIAGRCWASLLDDGCPVLGSLALRSLSLAGRRVWVDAFSVALSAS
jgi:hypothetical protein